MGRPIPRIRVVVSNEEAELQAKADGKSSAEVTALLAEREANQKAVQDAYDHTPPSTPFRAQE